MSKTASATTAKPARKPAAKAAAAVPAAEPAPAKRRTPRKAAAPDAIGSTERHHLIEVAAYYIAERRGFHGESSHEDWLQAEREIDAMIAAGAFTK